MFDPSMFTDMIGDAQYGNPMATADSFLNSPMLAQLLGNGQLPPPVAAGAAGAGGIPPALLAGGKPFGEMIGGQVGQMGPNAQVGEKQGGGFLEGLNGGKPLTLQDYMSLGTMTTALGGAAGTMFKPLPPPRPVGFPGSMGAQPNPSSGAATQLMGSLAGRRRGSGYRV